MSRIDDIAEVLQATPNLKASEIAKALGVERQVVNQVLHHQRNLWAHGQLKLSDFVFAKSDAHTWSVTNTTPQTTAKQPSRRPGPFGPARDLIPHGQHLVSIKANWPCHRAIAMMADESYSTLPVRNAEGKVVGVFTHAVFAERVEGLRGTNLKLKELCDEPVENMMVDPVFLDLWSVDEPPRGQTH